MPKQKNKKAQKKVLPVFHIFCEGKKTEPYYLNPYTNVHELLADIQNFLDGKPSCRKTQ